MQLLWSCFITLFPHKMRPESPAWKSAWHLSRLYQVSELVFISSPFPHYTSCVWSCKQAEHCVIVLGTLLTKAREEQKLEPELRRLINKRGKKICFHTTPWTGGPAGLQVWSNSDSRARSSSPGICCFKDALNLVSQFVLYAIRLLSLWTDLRNVWNMLEEFSCPRCKKSVKLDNL